MFSGVSEHSEKKEISIMAETRFCGPFQEVVTGITWERGDCASLTGQPLLRVEFPKNHEQIQIKFIGYSDRFDTGVFIRLFFPHHTLVLWAMPYSLQEEHVPVFVRIGDTVLWFHVDSQYSVSNVTRISLPHE